MWRTVLLYGQSLLLSGVAASLGQTPGLRVSHAATWAEAIPLLAPPARIPDVLIFDLTNSNESHVLPLLLKNPRILMIGLDAECNQAVLVSGQPARSLTLNQITELVHEFFPRRSEQ